MPNLVLGMLSMDGSSTIPPYCCSNLTTSCISWKQNKILNIHLHWKKRNPAHRLNPVTVFIVAKKFFQIEAAEIIGNTLGEPCIGGMLHGNVSRVELLCNSLCRELSGCVRLVNNSRGMEKAHTVQRNKN